MGTTKRERQKANRIARIEEEIAAEARSRRNRTVLRLGIIGAVVALAIGAFVILGGDDDDPVVQTDGGLNAQPSDEADDPAGGDAADTDPVTTTSTTSTTTTAPTADGDLGVNVITTTTALSAEPVTPECPPEDASGPRITAFTAEPPTCIDPTAIYLAEVQTSAGDFTMRLDPALDEPTVNNFVFLAGHNYYDGIVFHRIVPGFVIQAGDPTGTGSSGPGYTYTGAGRPESSAAYVQYSVSMANVGSNPETNGSQFFVALENLENGLSADFTHFGQVTGGTDVIDLIATSENGEVRINDVVITVEG